MPPRYGEAIVREPLWHWRGELYEPAKLPLISQRFRYIVRRIVNIENKTEGLRDFVKASIKSVCYSLRSLVKSHNAKVYDLLCSQGAVMESCD
ncbi:MAG: hypothetical protein CL583_01950 [Alteromonadaceae bacterium]|nr:hypothetical protein [Alteromonadaceae bacterium]